MPPRRQAKGMHELAGSQASPVAAGTIASQRGSPAHTLVNTTSGPTARAACHEEGDHGPSGAQDHMVHMLHCREQCSQSVGCLSAGTSAREEWWPPSGDAPYCKKDALCAVNMCPDRHWPLALARVGVQDNGQRTTARPSGARYYTVFPPSSHVLDQGVVREMQSRVDCPPHHAQPWRCLKGSKQCEQHCALSRQTE